MTSPRVIVRGTTPFRVLVIALSIVAVVVIAVVPVLASDFQLTRLAQLATYAVALLGLNIVSGMSGQISLGHGAFFGIGAYTTAILSSEHDWPFLATLPVAAVLGAVSGLVVGVPALRLKGMYLAIVTLAFGTAVPIYLQQPASTWLGAGEASGVRASFPWQKPVWFGLDVSGAGWKFLVLVTIAAIVFAFVAIVLRSRVGRALVFVASGERTAAVSGVWTAGTKVGAFVVSSMLGSLAGGMYMLVVPIVSPLSIGFNLSLLFLTAMIVGGRATVAGAIVGAAVMVYLPPLSSDLVLGLPALQSLTAQVGLVSNIVYGIILLLCVFFLPGGVMPAIESLIRRFLIVLPDGSSRERPPLSAGPIEHTLTKTIEEVGKTS